MQIRHHFTTAYCPLSNGTVKSLCKEVLRIARALVFEWKLSVGEWPAITFALQNIIIQSAVERLARNKDEKVRCPMKVFIGLKSQLSVVRPLLLRTYRDLKYFDKERCREIMSIEKVHHALEEMHKRWPKQPLKAYVSSNHTQYQNKCVADKDICRWLADSAHMQ